MMQLTKWDNSDRIVPT